MFSCFEKPQTFFEKPFYEEIDFGGNWISNIGTIPGFLEIEKYKKHFFKFENRTQDDYYSFSFTWETINPKNTL
jgi:hypothetical protein